MPAWAWIIIVVAIGVVAAVAWTAFGKRRTGKLQEQFGPEYDRTVGTRDSKREAESELMQRQKRREELDIKPLAPEARDRYRQRWQELQGRFVDAPEDAVHDADHLVTRVMKDRGYPMDDFETRAGDISVDHPEVVENYRAAHQISRKSNNGGASTEELRQATVHYRALFEELLETREPVGGEARR